MHEEFEQDEENAQGQPLTHLDQYLISVMDQKSQIKANSPAYAETLFPKIGSKDAIDL